MVNSLRDFVHRIEELNQRSEISDAYYVFEEECTDSVREQIYLLADVESPEPFRSAMHNIGYPAY